MNLNYFGGGYEHHTGLVVVAMSHLVYDNYRGVRTNYLTLALLYSENYFESRGQFQSFFFSTQIISIIMCSQFQGNLHRNWGSSIH